MAIWMRAGHSESSSADREFLDALRGCLAEREHATDMDERVQPAPPATAKELSSVERHLGFELPHDVKLVYQSIGNGGFGPGYGLVGVGRGRKGFSRAGGSTSADDYFAEMRNLPAGDIVWPKGLLPVVDWGCAIHSCVDLTSRDGQMIRFFGDAWYDEGPDRGFVAEGYDFKAWLNAWIAGFDHWEGFQYPNDG